MNTLEESKRKSNRSKADLFEVLVAIGLGEKYGLETAGLIKDKKTLEERISEFQDGEVRIKEQYKRAEILRQPLNDLLDKEAMPTFGKPVEIIWVGRRWQSGVTLSDIELVFAGNKLGISLKSTRQGSGTQKNIGYAKLKKLLGIDIDRELTQMWEKIRKEIAQGGGEISKLSTKPQGQIKEAKYQFQIIQELGNKYGLPVQKLAVEQSVNSFNSLSQDRKIDFLKEVFGVETTHRLLNAFVEGDKPIIFWNETVSGPIGGTLVAKKLETKSYEILADDKPLVRIQASFTNGIGLSAFCERVFLF